MMTSWNNKDSYMEEMTIKYTRPAPDFIGPRPMTEIDNADIDELLLTFAAKMYNACDSEKPGTYSSTVLDRCAALFQLDNNVMELSNFQGELTPHYPSRLLIPATQRVKPFIPPNATEKYIVSNVLQPPSPIDAACLRHHWHEAKYARCRTRLPVPVIRIANKYICRSSTLAGLAEVYGRATSRMLMSLAFGDSATEENRRAAEAAAAIVAAADAEGAERNRVIPHIDQAELEKNMSLMDATRANDIKLLKYLKVSVIADLMVEMKKVKFGVNVTSSEKVDKEKRYAEFLMASMPYPGCEFFKLYRDHAHAPQSVTYNWSEEFNNAIIQVGDIKDHVSFNCKDTTQNGNGPNAFIPLGIDWNAYRGWNLQKLTLNYMRNFLQNIKYSDSGMLVHCISGWDRTPLFISLLRITLWADGLIHQSLDAMQMMYLTVAYDWYLFGHNLTDRLNKGEDIFFFCFNMLKYMGERDLCMHWRPSGARGPSDSSNVNANLPTAANGRMNAGSGGAGPTPQNLDLDGMPFEMDDLDSANSLAKKKNGNYHAVQSGKRNRTASGCSSISEENADSGSMESLFVELELSEAIRESPREEDEIELSNHQPTNNINVGKSSPMSVPRQRTESTSSLGSWAMVTTTGSYNRHEGNSLHQSNHRNQRSEQEREHIEASALSTDDPYHAVLKSRSKRLVELREQFYLRYWSTIGRSKSHGALGAFLKSFVGKVGLSSKRL